MRPRFVTASLTRHPQLLPLLPELFSRCQGNIVRIREILLDEHALEVPYSTLTRLVRQEELLQSLPTFLPPIYHIEHRLVDLEG
ncbi:MAG: hypothetical protein HQL94_03825, partial [Magnetococcales bacterium]|nr:hypothetical protein [Magnetococcales bacterium]